MVKIKCEAGQFKKFIQAVKIMNNESNLHLNPDGISLIVVDTANVAMARLTLKSKELKGYQFKGKEPVKVALDWSKISKVLNAATKAQTPLSLEFTEKLFLISYEEIDATLHLLDPNTIRKEPNPPNVELNTTFDFDGSKILKMGKILFGEKLLLTVKDCIAWFSSEGDYSDTTQILLSKNGQGGDARALYSWEYWKDMGKVLDRAYVTAAFKSDHPIKLSAKIQGIEIEYLLAPRIEAD